MSKLARLLTVLLCLAVALSLFACSDDPDTGGPEEGYLPDGGGEPDGGVNPDEGGEQPDGGGDLYEGELDPEQTKRAEELIATLVGSFSELNTFEFTVRLSAYQKDGGYTDERGNTDGTEDKLTESGGAYGILAARTENGVDVKVESAEDASMPVYLIDGVGYVYDFDEHSYRQAAEGEAELELAISTAVASALSSEDAISVGAGLSGGKFTAQGNTLTYAVDLSREPNEIIDYLAGIDPNEQTFADVLNFVLDTYGAGVTLQELLADMVAAGNRLTVAEVLDAADAFLTDNLGITLQQLWAQLLGTPEVQQLIYELLGIEPEVISGLKNVPLRVLLVSYLDKTIDECVDILLKLLNGESEIEEMKYSTADIAGIIIMLGEMPVGTIEKFNSDLQDTLSTTELENCSVGIRLLFEGAAFQATPSIFFEFLLKSTDTYLGKGYDASFVLRDDIEYTATDEYSVVAELILDSASGDATVIALP